MKLGAYIHIPFCKQKCSYCDFVSFDKKEYLQENYIEALAKEIEFFKKNNLDCEFSTIYIGGGTPSFIDSKYIEKIMSLLNVKNSIETTIEINPGTVNQEKLETYKRCGINRLSIGLQSTHNKILNQIGRIHNFEEFLSTYNLAKKVGFQNINVDLMIGLPNQTILDIKQSLEKVVNLEPTHISVYSLILEEGTKMESLVEQGTLKLPSEELERNMYWYVKDFLELHNFKHYEISNFAKSWYESKHNLDCWNQNEYIGFGIASHSYIDKIRFSNINNIENYIKNCNENEFQKNKIIQEKQDTFSQEQEFMLLGLRKIEGVSIQSFKNKFGESPIFLFKHELNKLIEEKLIQIDSDKIKLTNKGLDLANLVWEEFV